MSLGKVVLEFRENRPMIAIIIAYAINKITIREEIKMKTQNSVYLNWQLVCLHWQLHIAVTKSADLCRRTSEG